MLTLLVTPRKTLQIHVYRYNPPSNGGLLFEFGVAMGWTVGLLHKIACFFANPMSGADKVSRVKLDAGGNWILHTKYCKWWTGCSSHPADWVSLSQLPMDWFKGYFTGPHVYFMGEKNCFPVKIFP